MKFEQPEWATYCEDRSPKFKVHDSRGRAFSALSDKMPDRAIQVLHFADGEWQVTIDFVPPEVCEECGGSFDYEIYGRTSFRRLQFKYDTKVPKYDLLIICKACYDKHHAAWQKTRQEMSDLQLYNDLKTKLGL